MVPNMYAWSKEQIEREIIKQAKKVFRSHEITPSTLPPGSTGFGGQEITGWVNAEPLSDLLETIAWLLRKEDEEDLRGDL